MRSSATTVFLCGYVENEDEVRDLFDLVVCLVVDEETLTRRLADRTTNAFGSQPEELAAALQANKTTQAVHQRSGASIIDATQPVASVTDAVLAAAGILQ
jgi:uridine kinase